MRYFFVTADGNLVPLLDFRFAEGQSQIVRIPVFGGTVYSQTRRGADTFRMVAASMLPQVGHFRVVGEDCVVYGCVGSNVSVENGQLVVTGVVHDRYEVDEQHRSAALQMMRTAVGPTAGG